MSQGIMPFRLPRHEEVLLRLYRCMTVDEQSKLLVSVLSTLACRYSLDPYHSLPHATDAQEEFSEGLDDRLISALPVTWPGQQFVDLDNTGDLGAWLNSSPR